MVRKVKLAVFASGTGTNFQALNDAILQRNLNAEIVRLIVDKSTAGALNLAKLFGIPATAIKYSNYETKIEAEQVIINQLETDQVDGILLAGYMRILTPKLIDAYSGKIINLHPAMLPKFPGRHSILDAFEAGVSETGVTVHFVDNGIDTGEIIAQEAVPILVNDTIDLLETRIHNVEHVLYPNTLAKLIDEGVFLK
ncbi:phosphoribosylglycinamide formyltransferase [Leuconostoc mesenteroides]|jgi:formyltetrahydrofolate-dependent phosphoribosylglycinamide formyltransferase (EC 2.1.2.2)|uniref:phosphoribosylglycinamide formyltransferase n=1 Tax=Leuconostoc mesenteroides TaxID=1245 RepID=UPI00023409D5|nr:phosphoribosylglycinamide formyltransferase [Leuconostoc mesenteroides]AET30124.1 phosphoribosylglycinamide formyltransferase [Leuconostoc mesenteroides subsp. mesenteroides J18]AQU49109.1 phosphoribosylglycinamide formyltransferase [Leuconostoc mesenteroides subsp. mesenteroides]KGB50570.1 phosphoribosylglycinamide formyltransferase [Leuconostoc mesenteroides P45]MBS0942220.1 phosphoribosylglycinamide formyltransferase [Leuconostoc mesenteroides]MBZ1515994.1 phosphoribosylglycinamide formy